MKFSLGNLLGTLGISLFVGVIIVAIGFGAAIPAINRVAGPLACGGKKLELSTETYSYRPGDTTTTITWFCVDETSGDKQDSSFQVVAIAGVIYSLVIFVVWAVASLFRKQPMLPSPTAGSYSARPVTGYPKNPDGLSTAHKKLAELKELRDSNLISEDEYERKKAEILEGL